MICIFWGQIWRLTLFKMKGPNVFKAKDIMVSAVISVKPSTEAYEAIRLLVENNITGLPVVNDDMSLAGIVSEKDVLKLLYYNGEATGEVATTVEKYMTKEVVSFDENENLIEICDSFIKNHFRRVPILSDGKLVGIISRRDIIKYILHLRHKDKVMVVS
ncbi:MAG: CBS domain-containing protein [Planctomycetes bacterium]|nr:CBS domain-containing protein [Planctomycetota bacterium]